MYIAVVPNRSSPPAILLRRGYRQGGKVKTETLANLSSWPREQIESLRRVLKNEPLVAPEEVFEIQRSLPHGHVLAVLGTIRRLGLDKLIASQRSRQRDVVLALMVARVIEPGSKLATARGLAEQTVLSSLAETLQLDSVNEDELYDAMDWLVGRQGRVEAALAKRHLVEGSFVLYDVTSTYFEGRHCPLAKLGYSRDGKKGKLQIVFGLLCNAEGCPVAVEVFEGNTADPKTLGAQVAKVQQKFGLKRMVFVGDRGLITSARIREELSGLAGLDWVTALRAPAIRALLQRGSLQLSLFDEKDLAEVFDPSYPEERLIVCRNPLLAAERSRKRQELLEATEKELQKIVEATQRKKNVLRGKEKIGLRVGRVLGRFKVGKHFRLNITEDSFGYERDQSCIEREAALDGIYVIRTSASAEALSAERAVETYKQLSVVERAFRCLKGVDLKVRPIYHHLPQRVRAHVLLCMLAYHVEWHMRKALAPLLFEDEDKGTARARRRSVVAPAQRSATAVDKARTKKTQEGTPVHSFQTLLQDLATLAKNRVKPKLKDAATFAMLTVPTALQRRAFELLKVSLRT